MLYFAGDSLLADSSGPDPLSQTGQYSPSGTNPYANSNYIKICFVPCLKIIFQIIKCYQYKPN